MRETARKSEPRSGDDGPQEPGSAGQARGWGFGTRAVPAGTKQTPQCLWGAGLQVSRGQTGHQIWAGCCGSGWWYGPSEPRAQRRAGCSAVSEGAAAGANPQGGEGQSSCSEKEAEQQAEGLRGGAGSLGVSWPLTGSLSAFERKPWPISEGRGQGSPSPSLSGVLQLRHCLKVTEANPQSHKTTGSGSEQCRLLFLRSGERVRWTLGNGGSFPVMKELPSRPFKEKNPIVSAEKSQRGN